LVAESQNNCISINRKIFTQLELQNRAIRAIYVGHMLNIGRSKYVMLIKATAINHIAHLVWWW